MTQVNGRANQILNEGKNALAEYLRQEWLSKRSHLENFISPPPEKYKLRVEDYFRRLAEEN